MCRFIAQFFIDPLFNEEYVDRERNAVHSEFRSKFSTEYRRQEDVLRQVISPGHAMSRFRTGNLDSLHNEDGELRKALVAFYGRYYAANNMRLVVVGKETLPQLRAMVKPLFSAIKDFPVNHEEDKTPLFNPQFLPASINIVPNTEVRSVSYTFALPKNDFWMRKPLGYLGFVLGHEGEGSLAWLLKEQGWIESLSAGQGMGWRNGDTFSVSIALTPEGLKHLDTIDSLLFSHIHDLKSEGINEWRFDEIKRLGEIDFNFKERGEVMMEASHLASKMQQVDSPILFSMDYRLGEFDKELVQSFAAHLNAKNVLRVVTAPSLTTTDQTALYEVPYAVNRDYEPQKIDPSKDESYKALLSLSALPVKNPFVPESLTLIKQADDKPRQIIKHARFNAWHMSNTEFSVPRATVRVRLKSALVEQSVESAAMVKLLAEAIEADLNPVTYQAAMAGANFSVSATSRGIDLAFSGYSDSIEPLLNFTVKKLKTYKKGKGIVAELPRLESMQDALVRRYRNDKKDTPYRQMMGHLAATVYQPYWSTDKMADALAALDPSELPDYTASLFKQSEVTVLTAGNIEARQAKKLAKKLKGALLQGRSFKTRVAAKVTLIERAQAIDIGAKHQDNAVMLYLQGKDDSLQEQAALQLLAQTLSTPFYHQLRTQQQLGYIVFGSYYPVRDVPGAVFVVQSPQAGVVALEQAISTFLKAYKPDFDTQFHVHQLALVGQLSEKPKNLNALVSQYWQSLNSGDLSFTREEALIAAVEGFELDAFKAWYEQFLVDIESRHLLFYSQNASSESLKPAFSLIPHITDYTAFKAKASSVSYP
jgi:insulysin